MRPTPEQEVVRAARVYRTNRDVATALGVTSAAFARLCKRLGIATPHQCL